MANDQKVSLSYTKILALGPGQVGKSTFLYRLMGVMKGNIQTAAPETQPQMSTGIAEMKEACITYTSKTGALTSESWKIFDSGNEYTDLQSQLEGLMSLLVEQTSDKTMPELSSSKETIQTSVSVKSSTSDTSDGSLVTPEHINHQQHGEDDVDTIEPQKTSFEPRKNVQKRDRAQTTKVVSASPSHSEPQKSNIDECLAEFDRIKEACRTASNKTKFQMLLNIADIGGQPAFLEMLPSLTIGPALYLVFMKLLDGLTTRYPVAFKCRDGRESKLCKNYTYTSEEVIFTALSSIACFGNSDEEVEQFVTCIGDYKQTSSLALLVGTFRDQTNEKEICSINCQLQQQLELTDFLKDGLIHSKNVLEVNNYSALETEIINHRELLKNILENKFRKYNIPTRWLTLSMCLKILARREEKHEVSFEECVKLGQKLHMEVNMLKSALRFLHKYVGLVMYFPENNHLKNVVICDPQIVFTSISELIFDIYDPKKMHITESQHDHFVRTGCFSPQEIKPTKKTQKKKLLSINTLVHLMAHLNIIARVPSNLYVAGSTTDKETPMEYFFPAVLQTVDLSLIHAVTKEVYKEQHPEPLCVRFQTGYLPMGFVCALSANLIAERHCELFPLVEDGQKVTYKNKIRFLFQNKFDVIMMSHSRYCEFRVTKLGEGIEFWDSEGCPRIRTIICEAANRVINSMQNGSLYKLSGGFEVAFKCPLHQDEKIGHEPLAKLVYDDSMVPSMASTKPKDILCVSACKIRSSLTPEMKMWFGEVGISSV